MAQFPPPSIIDQDDDSGVESLQRIRFLRAQSTEDAYTAPLAVPEVNLAVISRLCRRGVAEKVRAKYWKLLIGFLPCETARWDALRAAKANEYREIVRLVCTLDESGNVVLGQKSYRTVDVDIPRTMPSMHFFNTIEARVSQNGVPVVFSPTQQSLRRIIHTLAGVNKGLGYVQGMNELVGHLLYAFANGQRETVDMEVESDVFFCFQTILAYLGDDFCHSLDFDQDTGISCTIRHFERLFQFLDTELWEHLVECKVESEFFAFRWITLLFTQEFNVPDVFRIWDFLLSFGEELRTVVLYTAVAMLHYQRAELLRMNNLCEMLPLLQSYPPCDVSEFIKIVEMWIDKFGFRLVGLLKVTLREDVVQLQRRYNVPVAGDNSWGDAWRGWMSSVKGLAKHVAGGEQTHSH